MTRWRDYGANDDRLLPEGDAGFAGVDERADPPDVEKGLASLAINKDFSFGSADTRGGISSVVWGEEYGVDFTLDFPVNFLAQGFQTIYGVCKFSDQDGRSGLLLAAPTIAYRVMANQEVQFIDYPLGTVLTHDVKLVQAQDRVLMFRDTEETLEWNPQEDFQAGSAAFTTITQTAVRGSDADNTYGAGTSEMPNASDGTPFVNRIFLPQGRDQIQATDILDYTRTNDITQRFKLKSGSNDQMMKIVPWTVSTLVVFFRKSIQLLKKVKADLSEVEAEELTDLFGLVGKEAWAPVGRDIWFVADGAVRTIGMTDENELQALAEPVSIAIQPFMDSISWPSADKIICASFRDKFYMAAPINGSTYNNAIAVFNFLTKRWMGYWQSDLLDPKYFVIGTVGKYERLFVVNGTNLADTKAHGALLVLNEGFADHLYGTETYISDELLTRGYSVSPLDQENFIKFQVDQATWLPSYTLDALTDGVNEETNLATARTKDREKYYVWGKADYVVDNSNDDHGDPRREDYSVELLGGAEIDPGANGFNPDLHQRVQEAFRVARRGNFVQFRIRNTQGRCNQHAVTIESRATDRSYAEKA